VILVDAVERLEPVQGWLREDWLREDFLPALPAETRVVIAGRRPPDPEGHPLTLAMLIDTVRRSAHPTTVPDACSR
jgi:hypothetical protein